MAALKNVRFCVYLIEEKVGQNMENKNDGI